MLSDRNYMRSEYPRYTTSVITWILSATVAAFVLQLIFQRLGNGMIDSLFALSPVGLRHGHIWSLVTYTLLNEGVLSLLGNCLGLFFLGRELIALLGTNRFLSVYLTCALVGGLAWLGVHAFTFGPALYGSTGCVLGLFILFACFYPDREISLLVFFVLPVTIKPKYVAWSLVAIDSVGFVLSEIPGSSFDPGVPIAYSSHLGGMLVGWAYFRFFHANNGWDRAASIGLPAWLRRRDKAGAAAPAGQPGRGKAPANLRAEVDRILDKINSEGFGSLTTDEKRLLDEAKDLLSRP